MCGICGKISRVPFDRNLLESMTRGMNHRGPDDEDFFFSGEDGRFVGLGHRRLSIIDLSDVARQPIGNEDNSIRLVANGEIYNYRKIRKRLKSLGHRFRSRSDSEVVLHAYEEWGTDCLSKLNGMFAFAIWDSNQELLFMARDLMGEKPLFYNLSDTGLTFSSELPVLIKDRDVSPEIDPESLFQYLNYQVIFSPGTILKDVRKLQPGHFAVYSKGELTVRSYLESAVKPDPGYHLEDIGTCAEKLDDVLNSITGPLMVSDVPIGVFLSGGLDSSLILALAAKNTAPPIHTFTIGFREKGFNELRWARKVAGLFGTIHHDAVVDLNITGILPDIIRHLGEPMADASVIPYYHLSRLAGSHVKVVLGGDGADEIFGGYRRHMIIPWLKYYASVAPFFDKLLNRFQAKDGYYASSVVESLKLVHQLSHAQKNGYSPWNPVFDFDELKKLINPGFMQNISVSNVDFTEYQQNSFSRDDRINRMLWVDQMTFLPEDILTKVDRMSMAHSLEVRAPLLHPDVVSTALSFPGKYKISRGRGKRILKMVAEKYLPSEIINRKKHGFNVPIDAWFRESGKTFARETLLSGDLVKDGLMNGDYIRKILNEHTRRIENHGRKLWALLVLEMWKNSI